MAKPRGLGKGLGAIIMDKHDDELVETVKLSEIRVNPYQPRTEFDEDALNDLASSIKTHGVLQPIILRKSVKGFEIVAGERRFRASKIAGKNSIPAIVKTLSEKQMMELAVIENLQREDLTALEEARSYETLMEKLNITQQEVATRLGKSRSYIANMLRLLQLPNDVKKLINEGKISGGHGRTLLSLNNQIDKSKVAQQIIDEKMSVRQLEFHVKQLNEELNEHQGPKFVSPKDKDKDRESNNRSANNTKPQFILKQEEILKKQFGTDVEISNKNKKGKISFSFKNEEEFKRLIDTFMNGSEQ